MQVVVPRTFSLVCFRLLPCPDGKDDGYKLNYNLMDTVNSSGKIFISHTVSYNLILCNFIKLDFPPCNTCSDQVEHVDSNHFKQVLSGQLILRFAVGAPLTEERHIKAAWKVLQDQASALLADPENTES